MDNLIVEYKITYLFQILTNQYVMFINLSLHEFFLCYDILTYTIKMKKKIDL